MANVFTDRLEQHKTFVSTLAKRTRVCTPTMSKRTFSASGMDVDDGRGDKSVPTLQTSFRCSVCGQVKTYLVLGFRV